MSIKLIAYFYVHQQKTFAYLLGFNRLIPIWKKKKSSQYRVQKYLFDVILPFTYNTIF